MIEWSQIAIGGLGVICGLLGWFARVIWDDVQRVKQLFADHKVEIAEKYVPYARLQDALKPILDAIEHLRADIGTKADKD